MQRERLGGDVVPSPTERDREEYPDGNQRRKGLQNDLVTRGFECEEDVRGELRVRNVKAACEVRHDEKRQQARGHREAAFDAAGFGGRFAVDAAYFREELFDDRKFQNLMQESDDAQGEGIENGVVRRQKVRPEEVDFDARGRETECHRGVDRCCVEKRSRERDADDSRPIVVARFFEVPGKKKSRHGGKNEARQVKQKRQEGFAASPRGKDEVVVLERRDGGFPHGREDEDRTHGTARAGTENMRSAADFSASKGDPTSYSIEENNRSVGKRPL